MNDQVMFYLQIAFWALVFLLFLCYCLFPLSLPFVSELFKRRHRDCSRGATVIWTRAMNCPWCRS